MLTERTFAETDSKAKNVKIQSLNHHTLLLTCLNDHQIKSFDNTIQQNLLKGQISD